MLTVSPEAVKEATICRMTVRRDLIKISTQGHTDVVDITKQVESAVARSGINSGLVALFAIGSTAGLTTIEFEPGLVHDIREAFERIAPRAAEYKHHERWGDDNGHSHVRASLLGPSLTVPFNDGRLALGTWQQIVLVDFDTRARDREVSVQILGD